jgi:hypothetical protein
LIRRARESSGAEYLALSYHELDGREEFPANFDVVVASLSILTEDIHGPLTSVDRVLSPAGFFVIQTVHPWAASRDQPYENGWREETFRGWSQPFISPMPWYFRTLESWFDELTRAGFGVDYVREPIDPGSRRRLSLFLFSTLH